MRSAAQPADLPFPAPNGATRTGPFPVLHGGDLSVWMNPLFRIYDFFNTGVIRYWYLQDPDATDEEVANFDWLANRASVGRVANQYDATNPNIDRFLRGGGKLLIVQGTTDMLVPPAATNAYYESLVDRYRGRIRNTVRYYVQPGYGHGSGDFNLSWDSLAALDAWVTRGDDPDHPIAYDGNPATAGRSMPLCEYPKWPRYNGTGDPNSATSYTCVHEP
jgi:Tannase and feruloyl esterase